MDYRISHALSAGTAHRQENIPCQDSIGIFQSETALCVALADGAGSRSASHIGAQTVTAHICRYVSEAFEALYPLPCEKIAELLLTQCLQALCALPCELADSASTLLCFAASKDGRCITAHLGDGMMLWEQEKGLCLFSPPENNGAPNITWFTTSRDALTHLRIQKCLLPPTGAILLTSDGCAGCLYQPATDTVAPACSQLLSWHRKEDAALSNAILEANLENVFSQHTADDQSIAIISWQ